MKDDKPAKKMVPRDVMEKAIEPFKEWLGMEEPVAALEPAEEATLPTGTHADNVKKNRRPGKP